MTGMEKDAYGAVLRARGHFAGNDLPSVVRAIWQRRRLPLFGFLGGVVLAVAVLAVSPPLYSASARIMVDAHDGRAPATGTEIAIIESTPVLSKVAGVLGLYRDPFFAKPSWLERLTQDQNDDNVLRERVLDRLAKILDVSADDRTHIIGMVVRHPDPERAAQIANVVLTSYQERKNDERFEQSRQLGGWMENRLDAIKGQWVAAKENLEAFLDKHPDTGRGDSAAQVRALSDEIAATRAQITDLERKLRSGDSAGQSTVTNTQVRRIEAELAALSTRYGDKHPKMIEKRAELAKAKASLRSSGSPRNGRVVQDLAAAQAHIKDLQVRLDAVVSGYDSADRADMDRRTLEAQVVSTQHLYENMVAKYQDMLAQTEMQDFGTKVISMATIPSTPDQRARIFLVLASGAAGFLVCLLLVLSGTLWNAAFTSVEQLENMAGYPVFAVIPATDTRGTSVHHTMEQSPAAILAESLRSLRVSLRLRAPDGRRTRVVALTSTLPGEGKTSLSVMLGMIAAKSGERVAIVDCDLRKPSVHKAFGIGNARGIQDYLAGNAALDDVIYRKDPSGVHLLTTKAVPSYSLTLLTSGRMESLIESLREQYDLIILDAPSSLAFADARVLARMVDQTLYVVSWNRTRREGVLASLKAYADMGYGDLALVLNKVGMQNYLRDSASAVLYQYGVENAHAEAA